MNPHGKEGGMSTTPEWLDIEDTTHSISTTYPSIESTFEALPEKLRGTLFRASELAERERRQHRETPLPTSVAAVDRLLDGGLPRGVLVELVGRGSCGRFATLLAALRAITGAGEAAALVDQGEQLDPQAAAAAGVDLERLLWLRPRCLPDSLAAAEMLVHTGFPMVALDLGLPPVRGRAPLAAWLRLARSCAEHGAVALAGVPYRLSGCAAGVVLQASRGRGAWSGTMGTLRLLEGLRAELHAHGRQRRHAADRARLLLSAPDAVFGPNHEPPVEEGTTRHVEAI